MQRLLLIGLLGSSLLAANFQEGRAEWPNVLPPNFIIHFPYFNPLGGNRVPRRRPENIVGGVVVLADSHENIVLTAHHVWWALEGNGNAKLIAMDSASDLVLFSRTSSRPHSEAILMRDDAQLKIDSIVWSYGTPFLESRFRKVSSTRARDAYALLRGERIGMDNGKIIHSADIVPGFSGFPLLMKNPSTGEWVTVGINTELYFDGINGAAGPSKIEAFLKRSLSYEQYSRLNFLEIGSEKRVRWNLFEKFPFKFLGNFRTFVQDVRRMIRVG